MRELVKEQCLSDIFLDIDDYKFVYERRVLGSHNWMDIIRCARSLIIDISVVKAEKREGLEPGKELFAYSRPDTLGRARGVGGSDTDLSKNSVYDSNTDEDIEVSLAQAKMEAFQSRQQQNSTSNQLIKHTDLPPYHGSSLSRRKSKERKSNLEKVEELTRSGLIVNDPDLVAAEKTVKMYSLKPEPKVPVKPHVEELLHKNSEQVLEQSSQHTLLTRDKRRSSQELTEPHGTIKGSKQLEGQIDPPKIALRAPPFLTWRLEGPSEKSNEDKPFFDASKSEGLKHILSRVETKITRPNFNLLGVVRGKYGEEDSFGRGVFYKETPSIDLDELEKSKTELSDSLKALHQRLTRIDAGSPMKTDALTPGKVAFNSELISEKDYMVVLRQTASLHERLQSVVELAEDLITYFVPPSYDHSLLKKFWGALQTFIEVGIISRIYI